MRMLAVLLPILIWMAPARGADCPAGETGIQVIRHRWHTGIVIPADSVRLPLAFLQAEFPQARYLEFGWGDTDFYRNTDNPWLMIKALFWPTRAVVHVVGLRRPPAELPHTDLQALPVTPAGMADLQQALAASFHRNDTGEPVIVESGLYGDSRFYRGTGTFWLGHTCNTWTVRMLAAAGKPVHTFPALTAGGVMRQTRSLERSCP